MTKPHNPDGRIRVQDRPHMPESGQDNRHEDFLDESVKKHSSDEDTGNRKPRQ